MYRIVIIIIFIFIFACSLCRAETAVVHHSASGDVSAATIDVWHKARGWEGIGYHYVIRANGVVEEGRSLNKVGAHAKGRNDLIGICLTGRDTFTQPQVDSLIKLCHQLGITELQRHHEECPGAGLDVEQVNQMLKRRLYGLKRR